MNCVFYITGFEFKPKQSILFKSCQFLCQLCPYIYVIFNYTRHKFTLDLVQHKNWH